MKKIKLEDMEVLAGLEWTALSPDQPEKKAMSEFMANNKGVKKGIVMRSNGITVIGRPGPKEAVPGLPSAAAMLALANQKVIDDAGGLSSEGTSEEHNWIVAEALADSENEMWMGVVKNGVPIPGSDIVGPRELIIEEITEIINTSNNFTVFTLDKQVRYNVIAQVNVVEKRFVDLIQGVPPAKAKLTMFSIGGIVAVGVLVIAMALIGLWWGYSQWAEKERIRKEQTSALAQQEAQKQQLAADKVAYEKSVKDALLVALKQGVDEINAGLSSPSPYENVEAWRNLIYNVDLYQSGWDITGIDCMMEESNVPVCKVKAARGNLGVNRLLLSEHPESIIEGDTAYYLVRGPAVPARPGSFASIASSLEFTTGLISDLQSIRNAGVQHTVDASQDIIKEAQLPPPPASLTGAAVEAVDPAAAPAAPAAATGPVAIQMGVASGKIMIQGQGLWQLSGVGKYLDVANVRARDVTLSITTSSAGTVTWSLGLDYFVRTLPQPVLPTVPFGAETISVELPAEYRTQKPIQEGGIDGSTGTATNPSAPGAPGGDPAAPAVEIDPATGTPPPPPPPVG